uniref:Uncharacterized protein n=1 Tax=Strigamia maritima TaxID=126957 RepID=T1JM63_STRMM
MEKIIIPVEDKCNLLKRSHLASAPVINSNWSLSYHTDHRNLFKGTSVTGSECLSLVRDQKFYPRI